MSLLQQNHITFHVGLPKSASTTIQKYISKAASNNFLGHENSSDLSERFLLVAKAVELDLEELANEVNMAMDMEPWFFSSEFCSSYWTPLSGAHPQSIKEISNRLYKLAPHAKVLIILRNPIKMMESLYSQLLFNESYALSPHSLSYEEWIDRNILLHNKGWQSAFDLLNYSRLIEAYGQFENLQVKFLEEITKDFESFVNDWLIPWSRIKVTDKYEKSQENKRHASGEVYAKRIIRRTLKRVKHSFPLIVQVIPTKFLQRLELFWNGIIILLPGSMTNLKIRKDQGDWMENHFSLIYADLPKEIKKTAKELGYPIK